MAIQFRLEDWGMAGDNLDIKHEESLLRRELQWLFGIVGALLTLVLTLFWFMIPVTL